MLRSLLDKYAHESFIITIYDANLKELAQYQIPVSIMAPFAHRIAGEVLKIPNWSTTSHNFWYTLTACSQQELQRSPLPSGLTSLYGTEYTPEIATSLFITKHPEAPVGYFEVCLLHLRTELY